MNLDGGAGVRESDLPWVDIGVRPGYKQRYKGFFDKSRGLGARIGSLYTDAYYHSPRHRHTFQQIRYVVEGKLKYGHEAYGAGDCFYLPEGTHYGPIKPISDASGEGTQAHYVDMQFEGPSGIPYPDPDDVLTAQRELAKTGTFEEGVYTFPNGRKRDAYEAILEKVTGQPIEYPPSRLGNYVVMRSSAYPWVSDEKRKGIALKHLGFLFESGPNIKLVQLKAGAALPAGRPVGHRAVFLISGELEFRGDTFPSFSYFILPDGGEHAALTARQDTELLLVGWSRPGRVVPFELF
jgi:hypothetical protein